MSLTRILPFKADHIKQIRQQPHDLVELANFTDEQYAMIEKMPDQYSIEIDGRVRACCGLTRYWENRGEVWVIFDVDSGMYFIRMVRAMKKFLDEVDCRRIEACVISNFIPGHRLVKLLGFALEAPLMRKYGVTGFDYSLYAKVKQ